MCTLQRRRSTVGRVVSDSVLCKRINAFTRSNNKPALSQDGSGRSREHNGAETLPSATLSASVERRQRLGEPTTERYIHKPEIESPLAAALHVGHLLCSVFFSSHESSPSNSRAQNGRCVILPPFFCSAAIVCWSNQFCCFFTC